ncbi:nucleobindin 1 isoform X2 [Xylocopa sonorina]|uniref:nucleobindin 1 isoform X2 n=1 Tax=Xylocopa sonorina TaxID=1818115 RepID=UPI00403ACED8
MHYFLLLLVIGVTVQLTVAPPVNQKSQNEEGDSDNDARRMEEVAEIQYRRYLMEVVQVLESDPEFRAKLEKADDADIRTGKIADQLQFVNHNVRSRLDEIKREELERLRHLATKENELKNGLDIDHLKVPEHLDHTNTRTFEIQDLKKLIAKTTKDLAEADRTRRMEFKQHEMEKKYEEQEKLKHMNDLEKKKYEQELQALKEKRLKHKPVHHPGSKQQLEEVWEKQDHMESEEFNPRTFFFFHDVDGNGVWDQDEVKALFLKELDKLYAQGTPQEDMLRRIEEMERMREHVFNEADLNKDGLISYEEFLEQTKKPDFQQDDGWQSLDEQQIYTPEEFEQFEWQKQQDMKNIRQGIFPPDNRHAPAAHGIVPPQVDPSQNVVHQQQFQNQAHPQYHQQPQIPQQQQQTHGQVNQQQYHPGLSQQQQYQSANQQIPVQQLHSGPAPVQQHEGQVLAQQNHQQGQMPVQQSQYQAPNFQQHQSNLNQVPQKVGIRNDGSTE